MKKNYFVPLTEVLPLSPASPLCGSDPLPGGNAGADNLNDPGSITLDW